MSPQELAKVVADNMIDPAAAVWAFAEWLMERDSTSGPFSSYHNPAQMRMLAGKFCAAQDWSASQECERQIRKLKKKYPDEIIITR